MSLLDKNWTMIRDLYSADGDELIEVDNEDHTLVSEHLDGRTAAVGYGHAIGNTAVVFGDSLLEFVRDIESKARKYQAACVLVTNYRLALVTHRHLVDFPTSFDYWVIEMGKMKRQILENEIEDSAARSTPRGLGGQGRQPLDYEDGIMRSFRTGNSDNFGY